MNRKRMSRGKPLIALLAVMCAWVGARALILDSPTDPAGARMEIASASSEPIGTSAHKVRHAVMRRGAAADRALTPSRQSEALQIDAPSYRLAPVPASAIAAPPSQVDAKAAPWKPVARPRPEPVPVRTAVAHQMLWMAALARFPLPGGVLASVEPRAQPMPVYPAGSDAYRPGRWSADAWLMLRKGGSASLSASGTPSTYGASQTGAVVRYRLAPASPNRPAAYLRASAALNGSDEREAALGLSARPLARVPVVAAIEARIVDRHRGSRVRPAAIVYTELPEAALPMDMRGEAYGQAGYVGGAGKTAFVDGQIRISHAVLPVEKAELRAGAGAWGGAQKGASRLDVGPTADLRIGMGDTASARVAVDWRFRVAGDAAPASGPAITLSAGF